MLVHKPVTIAGAGGSTDRASEGSDDEKATPDVACGRKGCGREVFGQHAARLVAAEVGLERADASGST